MKNLNFTKKYTDRKTINSNNSVKFEVNWPRGSQVRVRHVKRTDGRYKNYIFRHIKSNNGKSENRQK
jgi:hypothetical protein